MRNIGIIRGLAAALLLAAPLTSARAASGLRSTFGEVVVRKLKIGQTYSLYKLLNLPLRVVNTSDESVQLRIETIHSDVLTKGYEAIPSLDWVRVSTSAFTVAPNHEAVSDVIITIPNDPSLLGRRFQADIWSHTTDLKAVLVGLQSRLLMQIDSTPPSEEELKKKFIDDTVANLDFTVLPVNGEAGDVPLGRTVDLRKERKISIKLINPNDRALNFRVRSIPVWESLITPPPGVEVADDPLWVKPEKDVVKVEGNSIVDVGMSVDLPDRDDLRGKHLFFLIGFDVLEQRIPTTVYYRLVLDTAQAKPGASPSGK